MNKCISTTIIIAIFGIILVSSISTNAEKLALSALKFQHKTNVDAFNSILGYFGIQLAHAEDDNVQRLERYCDKCMQLEKDNGSFDFKQ